MCTLMLRMLGQPQYHWKQILLMDLLGTLCHQHTMLIDPIPFGEQCGTIIVNYHNNGWVSEYIPDPNFISSLEYC